MGRYCVTFVQASCTCQTNFVCTEQKLEKCATKNWNTTWIAGRNVKPDGMSYQLKEIPEEKRQYKFVKYSFWMPIGHEGFYCH